MKPKDYNYKTTNIKGKQYVEVSERLKYLSDEQYSNYSIETSYEFIPNFSMFICKAILTISFESGITRTYTGHAQEIIGEGFINKTSALENCETSAVGRACAVAGIGVIDSVASIDEINKATNRSKQTNRIYEDIENALKSCTTQSEVKKIWENTPELQPDKTFIKLITSYKNKLNG